MTKVDTFNAPGFLTDLSDAQQAAWSEFISATIEEHKTGEGAEVRPQFASILGVDDSQWTSASVTWSAFPRRVALKFPAGVARYRAADRSRDVQDEYCEWSVERDAQGKVKRVTFTSEGPEYWEFLANTNQQLALDLYRQHVSPSVQREDIFDGSGRYIGRNRWNSTTSGGAMHLVQQANTLIAEIELAAAATVVREAGGNVLTSEQDLIACSLYGDPDRNSDPHIGGSVNALARSKNAVALANPVGLYIDALSTAGWETPDGTDALSFWRVSRGRDGFAVRAVFEVTGHNYLVGDIRAGGLPIQFGSQIAEHITMRLTGLARPAADIGVAAPAPRACLGQVVPTAALAAKPRPLSVAQVLAPPRSRRK